MAISSRFAVAVHVLTLLEASGGEPVTSERLAGSASTHPALVRRILCMLARAGLTTSRLGAGGGALLARPASQITLRDVYRAVEEGPLFAMHHESPDDRCPVGRHIQPVLEGTTAAARRALEEVLAGRTVADVARRVAARAAKEAAVRGRPGAPGAACHGPAAPVVGGRRGRRRTRVSPEGSLS
ncbi:MAG TPA: Rrf2 family transcriptional regulator [Longimicrobiales bacterium]